MISKKRNDYWILGGVVGAILFITGIVLTIIFVLKKAKDDVSIDVKIDKALVNFAEAYKKVNGNFS